MNTDEVLGIDVNGSPYAVAATEVTPAPPAAAIVGGKIHAPLDTNNNVAEFRFNNSAPAAITSLRLEHSSALHNATFVKVCADDATAVVPASPASIPTLNEWGLILLSGLMGLMGVAWMRRNTSAGRA